MSNSYTDTERLDWLFNYETPYAPSKSSVTSKDNRAEKAPPFTGGYRLWEERIEISGLTPREIIDKAMEKEKET